MNAADTEVDALVAEFLLALERGERPDPVDWLARHPAYAAELIAFLQNLGRFGSFLGLPPLPLSDATTEFRGSEVRFLRSVAPGTEVFAEYELLEMLGVGGMGTVYRARLRGTNLVVALKRVRPGGLDQQEMLQRFREEVENAAGLRHPHIVPIYHFGEHEGQPFFTMALVEGGSLQECLGQFRGAFAQTGKFVACVARAVHYAHQRRVLHRDLKPRNILVGSDGEPVVADFGLAARLDDSGAAREAGPTVGSLPWMAPEAVRGEGALTTVVDVWALGVILYEMLTGARPFQGAHSAELQEAILEKEPVRLGILDRRIPRDLEAICLRCLRKDPARRYESAIAVALDLERWLRDEPLRQDTRPTGRMERFVRWSRRNPGLLAGAASLVLILLAATVSLVSLVREQDERLRESATHANEFAARNVAANVHRRLDALVRPVVDAVNYSAVRRMCQSGKVDEVGVLALRKRFELQEGNSPFATITLYDQEGHMAVHLDNQRRVQTGAEMGRWKGDDYTHRDYYQGALRHLDRTLDADRVHLSRIFRSTVDDKHKFSISCAVRPLDASKKPWVLSATVTTNPTLGRGRLSGYEYAVVVMAPLDTNPIRKGDPPGQPGYVILVHPDFAPGDPSVPLPSGQPGPILAIQDGPELHASEYPLAFPPNIQYEDPVCGGRWLTASVRIANSELVVQVQQRYDDAVAPYRNILQIFLAKVGGAVVVGLGLFLTLRQLTARRREEKKIIAE